MLQRLASCVLLSMANEASERQRQTTALVASQSPAAAASDGFDDCHRSAGQCEVICFAAGAGSNWLKERRDFVGQLTRHFQRQGQGEKVRGILFVCVTRLVEYVVQKIKVQLQCELERF